MFQHIYVRRESRELPPDPMNDLYSLTGKEIPVRTRSCGSAYITQLSWLLHFHPTQMCRVEIICTSGGTIPKRHLGGASP